MSKNINSHIKEYLDYYIGLNTSPEYAVLLRGKWGVENHGLLRIT